MSTQTYTRPRAVSLSRWEFVADIVLTASQLPLKNMTLPTQGGQLPNNRFIHSLKLVWEGRITNAAANNPSGVQVDAPYSLIDAVQVYGTHRIRNKQEVFINARAVDLREVCNIYRHRGQRTDVSANGTLTTNTASSATLDKAASHFNDIRFAIDVPFCPLGIGAGQMIDWVLDAPNYDNLTLKINCSDDTSVFTYGTRGAPTFSAYGSGSGNPVVHVYARFVQFGDARTPAQGFVPGRVFRDYLEVTGSTMTTTATKQRLFNIPRGQIIRNILLKTGAKSTAAPGGFDVYNTLSESILSNIYLFKGTNKIIRYSADWRELYDVAADFYGFNYDTGYALMDFAPLGSLGESLDLRTAIVGNTGDVDTYVQGDVTGAANQAAMALFEQLFYGPSSGN